MLRESPGLTLPVQGHAVATTFGHVTIEAVVADVELAIGKPLRETARWSSRVFG